MKKNDNKRRNSLFEHYKQGITSGFCDDLFKMNRLTEKYQDYQFVGNCLEKNGFSKTDTEIIVELYNGYAENDISIKPEGVLTRAMIVYLCNVTENNKCSVDDGSMLISVEEIEQFTKPEKNTFEGEIVPLDEKTDEKEISVNEESPENKEIQRLKDLLSKKDQKIIDYEEKCMRKDEQIMHIERQFIEKEKEFKDKEADFKNKEAAVVAEYKKKTDEFEAWKENEKVSFEAELAEKREKESIAFEESRLLKAAELEKYYDDEYRKAQQKIAAYKEDGMAAAKDAVQKWYEDTLKAATGDYLKEKEDAWKDGHREFDSIRQSISESIAAARLESCNEASRMQREFAEQMSSMMAQFGANMDKWRASMYSVEFADFAIWASKFFGFVDRYDKRIVDNMNNGEISPDIVRIVKTLGSLRNQLDRSMTAMGLRCFYPQQGERFDPVWHEVDTDEHISMNAEILECKNPGVEMRLADTSNTRVLSKAEVVIKE